MKKITSFLLALFSTLLLAVGATQAAENFDTIGHASKNSDFSGPVMGGPSMPCQVMGGPSMPCQVRK